MIIMEFSTIVTRFFSLSLHFAIPEDLNNTKNSPYWILFIVNWYKLTFFVFFDCDKVTFLSEIK